MMDQTYVHDAAKRLIREYGAAAEPHVRRRLQDMISRRDVQGAGLWRRILRTLCALQRTAYARPRR